MAKYKPMKIYFVAVGKNKVQFLGTDFATICGRSIHESIEGMYKQFAKNYKDAAYIVAETYGLQLSEEVQENFKLLRGYDDSPKPKILYW